MCPDPALLSRTDAPESDVLDRKVSKEQVLKFVERQFLLADVDGDGALTLKELARFLRLISHPAGDLHDG